MHWWGICDRSLEGSFFVSKISSKVILYTFWNLGRCCEATHQKTHAGIGLALTGNHRFGAVMEAMQGFRSRGLEPSEVGVLQ